jgi:hypothetical protein
MNSSQRIVFNSVATYTHSVLGAGLALFSSRWVLNALGQTDFGLFSVVGPIIVFITFLNTVMAISTARHYAFSIGKGDMVEVRSWLQLFSGRQCLRHLDWPVFLSPFKRHRRNLTISVQ